MKRRVLRWYDYSWSRGRIQGGGDINTALGLLPDKLKTELALHVNLSVLKKVSGHLRAHHGGVIRERDIVRDNIEVEMENEVAEGWQGNDCGGWGGK